MGYYSTLETTQVLSFSDDFEKLFNEIVKKCDNENLKLSERAKKVYDNFINLLKKNLKNADFESDLSYLSNYKVSEGWLEPENEEWTAKHYGDYLLPFLVYAVAKETNEKISDITFKFTGENGEIWGYTVDFKNNVIKEIEYELMPCPTTEYALLE